MLESAAESQTGVCDIRCWLGWTDETPAGTARDRRGETGPLVSELLNCLDPISRRRMRGEKPATLPFRFFDQGERVHHQSFTVRSGALKELHAVTVGLVLFGPRVCIGDELLGEGRQCLRLREELLK
jgi:hypothetical protein